MSNDAEKNNYFISITRTTSKNDVEETTQTGCCCFPFMEALFLVSSAFRVGTWPKHLRSEVK